MDLRRRLRQRIYRFFTACPRTPCLSRWRTTLETQFGVTTGFRTCATCNSWKTWQSGCCGIQGRQIGRTDTQFELTEGRLVTASQYEGWAEADIPPREVVVDEKMNLEIGERILIGNKELKVVGKAKSLMFVLDTPLLFMDLRTAQEVLLKNSLHVNMMIAQAADGYTPEKAAKELENFDEQLKTIDVRTLKQTLRDIIATYVDEPMKAVQFLRVMLWIAAGTYRRNDHLRHNARKDARDWCPQSNRCVQFLHFVADN